MANPQSSDAHLRITHRIQEEIGMREFSKRQRKILDFILRLSWGCGSKSAYIPKQKYFTLYGVPEQDIKRELKWLAAANVIEIDEEEKLYSFNKDYDAWKISIVSGYDYEMFKEILYLNIETSQNTKNELRETRRSDFVKHEELEPAKPCVSMDESVSKEKLKEKLKIDEANKGAVPTEDAVPQDIKKPFALVLDYFSDKSGVLTPSANDIYIAKSLATEITVNIIKSGIDEAFIRYKPKHSGDKIRSLKYCEGTIRDMWEVEKAKDTKVDVTNSSYSRAGNKKNTGSDRSRFSAKPSFNNFENRKYDPKALEDMLLKKSRGELV